MTIDVIFCEYFVQCDQTTFHSNWTLTEDLLYGMQRASCLHLWLQPAYSTVYDASSMHTFL